MTCAVDIVVLKQVVARDISAGADDAREPTVIEGDLVFHTALAAEREVHSPAAHVDVSIPQRRQAKRTVLAGVLVVADADQRLLEKPDDERQYLFAFELLPPEIRAGAAADRRQRFREAN